MAGPQPCQLCSGPATVHIRHDATNPMIRHLCFRCAEAESRPSRKKLGAAHAAAGTAAVGLSLLVLSFLADMVHIGPEGAFTLPRFAGLAVSGLLVLAGALIRVPAVILCGLFVGGLSIVMDHLDVFSHPSLFGQVICGSIGVALCLVGLLSARMLYGDK